MRRLTDFKVVLVTGSNDTYTVTGERDTITATDTTFDSAYIPLKIEWENSSRIYRMDLASEPATQPPEERPMGQEILIHGQLNFSDPSSSDLAIVEFDFREYPSNVYDIFEMQLSDHVWHVDNYTNLEGQVRHMI